MTAVGDMTLYTIISGIIGEPNIWRFAQIALLAGFKLAFLALYMETIHGCRMISLLNGVLLIWRLF